MMKRITFVWLLALLFSSNIYAQTSPQQELEQALGELGSFLHSFEEELKGSMKEGQQLFKDMEVKPLGDKGWIIIGKDSLNLGLPFDMMDDMLEEYGMDVSPENQEKMDEMQKMLPELLEDGATMFKEIPFEDMFKEFEKLFEMMPKPKPKKEKGTKI